MKNLVDKTFELIEKHWNIPIDTLGIDAVEISTCEEIHQIRFPTSYRYFLKRIGSLVKDDLAIFGLGENPLLLPSVHSAIITTHNMHPDAPSSIVPIHLIDTGKFACLDCDPKNNPDFEPPIIFWDITKTNEEQNWQQLSPSFSQYFYELISQRIGYQIAVERLKWHVDQFDSKFGYDHVGKGKLPRNQDWRPLRFCSQDIVLGIQVLRHVPGGNFLEVDVFLTEDVPQFAPGSGLMGLTLNMLADAVRCGGTMEIRFSENVDCGQVPSDLVRLAEALGEPIKQESLLNRKLDPDDARRIFIALIDFNSETRKKLRSNARNPEQICYSIARGIWTKIQSEIIIQSHANFEKFFKSEISPKERIFFIQNLFFARLASMVGYLDSALERHEKLQSEGKVLELEDDVRKLEVSYDAEKFIRFYVLYPTVEEDLSKTMKFSWFYSRENNEIPLERKIAVFVRPRSTWEIQQYLNEDILAASNYSKSKNLTTFLCLPQNFLNSELNEIRDQYVEFANSVNINIMVCPDSTEILDQQASRNFNQGRIFVQ